MAIAGFTAFLIGCRSPGTPTSRSGLALAGVADNCWLTIRVSISSGRQYGKTPLSPRISPKKTREGFAGGLVMAGATSAFGFWLFDLGINPAIGAVFDAAIAILAIFGDLAESLLKRQAGVKKTAARSFRVMAACSTASTLFFSPLPVAGFSPCSSTITYYERHHFGYAPRQSPRSVLGSRRCPYPDCDARLDRLRWHRRRCRSGADARTCSCGRSLRWRRISNSLFSKPGD